MSVTFESIRFGSIEVAREQVIEFPHGLVGLGGLHFTLIDRNPGSGFQWLHSIEDPALALPVVEPQLFFPDFVLALSEEDRLQAGIEDLGAAQLLVTIRATPDPADITANLRAPIVVNDGRGFQVINLSENAPFQAPLFAAEQLAAARTRAA